jgi:glucose/arabinose dehydrogenase
MHRAVSRPRFTFVAGVCFLMTAAVAGVAEAAVNHPPATPVITEPATDGQIVNPADVHMETAPFSDPDGDSHLCTDWEIHLASTNEVVWQSLCNSVELVHIHLGDGSFVNSYAGRTMLEYDKDYVLRARHRDSSGDPATEWSAWASRSFRTSSPPPPGTAQAWTVRQAGFVVERFATGFQLPVDIAFVPNPGPNASSPYLYVTELYGNIKVVSRDGTVSDYIRGTLNYQPSGIFPGSGEQGMTGIVVEPASGDLFASMLYQDSNGQTHPKIMRFHSNHGGSVAGSYSTVLAMPSVTQGQSHQISNLSIGPDGKLYVHMGDGMQTPSAQNLDSFLGKILRMNLDGTACTDNPFYNASDGITSRDYMFAYGFRNPFGGDWRATDGQHYEVENGPSVDRFAKVVRGRNYLWDGTNASMANYAIYNWNPAVAPVNLAFVQPSTFGGSGFTSAKQGHAFVSESGATYATGPQTDGKRVSEFALDSTGARISGPTTLVEYTGTGKATAAGLAAGPDGLYFTDLYKDSGTSATDPGANVLRIRWVGTGTGDFSVAVAPTSRNIKRGSPTTYTVTVTSLNGFSGNVDLTVAGLPSGATGSFSVPSLTLAAGGSATSVLTVATASTSPRGTYQLQITASNAAANLNHSVSVSLKLRR